MYSASADYMMTYVDENENNKSWIVLRQAETRTPAPLPKYYYTNLPTCADYSLEGVLMIIITEFQNNKGCH